LELSVLDLSPIPEGSDASQALQNTLDLARAADELGFTRFWLAEHHNTLSIASSAPEVMIGAVAQVTSRIRVGSGGIMLPNHSSLRVAEVFSVLSALHPGRIDLGLGRAPGTDRLTAQILRRGRGAESADDFPQQLAELTAFLTGGFEDGHPYRNVVAAPVGAPTPDLWILGSSLFGAQAAAYFGVGFAFAHHINPGPAMDALRLYRDEFRPSQFLEQPQAILATSVICADTDEEADRLAATADLWRLRLGQGRGRQPLPGLEEALAYQYSPPEEAQRLASRSRMIVGSPKVVRDQLTELASTGEVTEVMVTTLVHADTARRRSNELLAEAFDLSPDS
jgi:luciferase family oxidoreductase group 1